MGKVHKVNGAKVLDTAIQETFRNTYEWKHVIIVRDVTLSQLNIFKSSANVYSVHALKSSRLFDAR